MSSSRLPRTVLGALALVGVGVGIGWFVFGHRAEPPLTHALPEPTPAVAAREVAPVLHGRPPSAPPTDVRSDRPSPPEVVADASDGVAGRIEVELDLPDWAWRHPCYVYALPAGTRGVAELGSVPHVGADPEERPVLLLPRAGTWDLFLASFGAAGAVLDIQVPPGATVPVRLSPYPSAPIRFRLEGGLPDTWPPDWVPVAEVHARPTNDRLSFPGRDDRIGLTARTRLREDGLAESPPVPLGRTFEVVVHPRREVDDRGSIQRIPVHDGPFRLLAHRRSAKAGETVAVHVLRRCGVRVHVRLDRPPPATWATWTAYAQFGLEVNEGTGDGWLVPVKPNRAPDTVSTLALWGDPGSARLTWKGDGFVAGSSESFRLEPGGTVDREITLCLDAEFSPLEAYRTPPDEIVRVSVEGWTEPVADGDLVFFGLAHRKEDGVAWTECVDVGLERPPETSLCHRRDLPTERGMAIRCPDLASAFTRIPPGGDLHLELRRAGHLLVATDRIHPPGMGALVLERADGLPFPVSTTEDAGDPPTLKALGRRIAVRSGWLVGPLPEGEVRFEVTLGGSRLPDAVGHVRPGRVGLLHIGR